MGMQDMGSASLNSEQTGSFTTLAHHEYPWRHNDISERIDNHKLNN